MHLCLVCGGIVPYEKYSEPSDNVPTLYFRKEIMNWTCDSCLEKGFEFDYETRKVVRKEKLLED